MKINEILLQSPTKVALSDITVDKVGEEKKYVELREEVLKELFRKNEEGEKFLKELYEEKEMLLRNLIVINDNFVNNIFEDKETFIQVFPFIPYQFKLIVEVVNSLKDKGLLVGEIHLSEIFRGVLLRCYNQDFGEVIPFSLFYDFMKEFMVDSYRNILKSEFPQEGKSVDEKIIKVLLLVKGIKCIPLTLDNIATLLVTNFDENRMDFKLLIKDRINELLQKGIIVEKSGVYEILSLDEQRINKEIEARYVTDNVYDNRLFELFYEDLFGNLKKRLSNIEAKDYENMDFELNGVVFKGLKNAKGKISVYSGFYRELGEDALIKKSKEEGSILVIMPKKMMVYTELLNALKLEDFLSEYRGKDFSKLQKTLIKNFGAVIIKLNDEIGHSLVYYKGEKCL